MSCRRRTYSGNSNKYSYYKSPITDPYYMYFISWGSEYDNSVNYLYKLRINPSNKTAEQVGYCGITYLDYEESSTSYSKFKFISNLGKDYYVIGLTSDNMNPYTYVISKSAVEDALLSKNFYKYLTDDFIISHESSDLVNNSTITLLDYGEDYVLSSRTITRLDESGNLTCENLSGDWVQSGLFSSKLGKGYLISTGDEWNTGYISYIDEDYIRHKRETSNGRSYKNVYSLDSGQVILQDRYVTIDAANTSTFDNAFNAIENGQFVGIGTINDPIDYSKTKYNSSYYDSRSYSFTKDRYTNDIMVVYIARNTTQSYSYQPLVIRLGIVTKTVNSPKWLDQVEYTGGGTTVHSVINHSLIIKKGSSTYMNIPSIGEINISSVVYTSYINAGCTFNILSQED